jgi:hypothetical protein
MFDESIHERLFDVSRSRTKLRQPVDRIAGEMKAIEIVQYRHIEWSRDCAFFLVAADVQVVMVGSPVREAMNQPGIAVIGEDNRLVLRED